MHNIKSDVSGLKYRIKEIQNIQYNNRLTSYVGVSWDNWVFLAY